MRTLRQIKDGIVAVQKELVLFEGKRAMLWKLHLKLVSFRCFYGMEIDHDSMPTASPNHDSIDNEVKAAIIAVDMINRIIRVMGHLQKMVSVDYEETRHHVFKGLREIRDVFPADGNECALWADFPSNDKSKLKTLLAMADDAIASHDEQELRRALTDLFKYQAKLLKRQTDEHLELLKKEREQLKTELQKLDDCELAEKCDKPYWVEVSGSEKLFVKNGAFPIPNVCAKVFIPQAIESLDADVFHYKRIYEYPEKPSSMRIFGFDSKEDFKNVVTEWDVTDEQSNDAKWFKRCVMEIDTKIYYRFSNELLPQWKAVLEKAVPILERESEEKWLIEMGKILLQRPVIELREAPLKSNCSPTKALIKAAKR